MFKLPINQLVVSITQDADTIYQFAVSGKPSIYKLWNLFQNLTKMLQKYFKLFKRRVKMLKLCLFDLIYVKYWISKQLTWLVWEVFVFQDKYDEFQLSVYYHNNFI